MEWFDFLGFLSKGEGNDLMFKKTIENPEDLANTIVHLANNIGGRIVIGIDINNSHLVGTNLNSDWVRTVAKTHCFPAIHINTDLVTKNSRDIMIINVPEGKNKPYVADRSFLFSDHTMPSQNTSFKQPEQKEINIPHNIEEPKKEEKPKSFFDNLNQRQKNTLEFLNQNENITNRKYRELFTISHKTAHLELTSLVEKGLLLSKGLGRSTHYILASKDNVPPMTVNKNEETKTIIKQENKQLKMPEREIKQEQSEKNTETKIEIKPLISNDNTESTEITIEVKDNHPKIKIQKHCQAKEMLENKILKDTIHRSKDFEKCQAFYANREEVKFANPLTTTLVKEKEEVIIKKIDYNKILNADDEITAKEILQEEKELMANKPEEEIEEEEIIKRPKLKEQSELRNSFRGIEKEREKRLNKQQNTNDKAEELQYEPVDQTEINTIIENPDIEITSKEEHGLNSENKEIIEDGPDQLGLDSFLSS